MALPDEHNLTFLRGSGFLLRLVGVWDLIADESSQWPSQKGFLIFKETQIIAVIERHEGMRRGIEGTYSVEGNRIIITELFIDTAPERGAPGDGEFTIDGDMLTIKWRSTNQTCQTPHHVDKFRRCSSIRAENRDTHGSCVRYPQADQGPGRHLDISSPVTYDEGALERDFAPW